ncbi:MAG: translation initiation factor IF-3 [Lachnospiraceae bacterium]|nr:translation initiation factor IF-3 [Lachnospiraceae bacterium]
MHRATCKCLHFAGGTIYGAQRERGSTKCFRVVFLQHRQHTGRYTTIAQKDTFFINEQIRDKEVRVIGTDGTQLGVMSIEEALARAEEAEVDLVKIAPQANPPVCRLVDYGKFRYEQLRKQKEARRKQRTVEIKEIRMSPNIDTNDLNTKITAARKFLEKGNRVKVTIRFRGREMAHMNASVHILTDFAKELEELAVIDRAPKQEGRTLTMILAEKSGK